MTHSEFNWTKDYEFVGISTDWDDKNEFLREYPEKHNYPFMWINKRQKYADVEIDFIFCDPGVSLSDEASKKTEPIVNRYFGKAIRLSKSYSPSLAGGAAQFSGFMSAQDFRNDIASEMGKELVEIVFNEDNWVVE